VSEWDEWDDWPDDVTSSSPSRAGLVIVAVIVLIPFVLLVGGGANAIDALGPGLLAVALFFAAVALTFVLVRRWLRRRLEPGGARR
jgi:membrane protein implicated in regulation of membrane protease activity